MQLTKKTFRIFGLTIYLLVCGEIIMRIISNLIVIPDIELLNYANNMVHKSNLEGLPNGRPILIGV